MSGLPKPSLTATILPAIGRAPRAVVVHGSRDWQRKAGVAKSGPRYVCHCSACGAAGHSSKSRFCPARGLT